LYRTLKAAVLGLSLFGAAAPASQAATYLFENKQAEIDFTYVVGFVTQSGHFSKIDGFLKFDRRAPEKGSLNAIIKTDSLTASNFQDELRGDDFFNVTVFPDIRFVSQTAHAVGDNAAEFSGALTMHGVTQPLNVHVDFLPPDPAQPNRINLVATAQLKRSAFNMTALSALVDDDIEIKIRGALIKEKK
jgi:polyisoprenoid-binding protein YceI